MFCADSCHAIQSDNSPTLVRHTGLSDKCTDPGESFMALRSPERPDPYSPLG